MTWTIVSGSDAKSAASFCDPALLVGDAAP
jgi:hypothetical protein